LLLGKAARQQAIAALRRLAARIVRWMKNDWETILLTV